MLVAVLLALGGADVPCVGAGIAPAGGQLAAALHQSHTHAAYLRAIDVIGDAMGQAGHVLLLQAAGGAIIASCGAIVTGVDAGLVLLLGHGGLPPGKPQTSTAPAQGAHCLIR